MEWRGSVEEGDSRTPPHTSSGGLDDDRDGPSVVGRTVVRIPWERVRVGEGPKRCSRSKFWVLGSRVGEVTYTVVPGGSTGFRLSPVMDNLRLSRTLSVPTDLRVLLTTLQGSTRDHFLLVSFSETLTVSRLGLKVSRLPLRVSTSFSLCRLAGGGVGTGLSWDERRGYR